MTQRYEIQARRNENEDWSTWTTTDDLYNIQKHYDRVRELGYESRVIDPKITYWEQLHSKGYLLISPVRPGDTRCILVDEGKDSYIERYIVDTVVYDGEKWLVIPENSTATYEVDSRFCLTVPAAKRVLKEIKKAYEEETEETEVTEENEVTENDV